MCISKRREDSVTAETAASIPTHFVQCSLRIAHWGEVRNLQVYQLTPSRPSRGTQSCTSSAINSGAIVVDCRPHLPRPSSPSGAVNNRPTAVAVYIALADSRRVVDKFSWTYFLSSEFGEKFQWEVPLFLVVPNFLQTQCSMYIYLFVC